MVDLGELLAIHRIGPKATAGVAPLDFEKAVITF